jgi:hypothetical protein
MEKPLPILIENCVQIAWDYLERSNQISDASFASRFLAKYIEVLVRQGERRQLLLSNMAITAYLKAMGTQKAA